MTSGKLFNMSNLCTKGMIMSALQGVLYGSAAIEHEGAKAWHTVWVSVVKSTPLCLTQGHASGYWECQAWSHGPFQVQWIFSPIFTLPLQQSFCSMVAIHLEPTLEIFEITSRHQNKRRDYGPELIQLRNQLVFTWTGPFSMADFPP